MAGRVHGRHDPKGYPVGRRRFLQGGAAVAAASLPLVRSGAARAGGACDPFTTPPSFTGTVPSPEDVLGFPVGVDREATSAEIVQYVNAVGSASDRVIVGNAGQSERGRNIRYAIVGSPGNVTPAGLQQVQQDIATIRDPSTPQATVDALASTTPAFLWTVGNLHGGEESGADASLQLLYELADRDDCAVTEILGKAVIVIIPSQNPDGREVGFRRNRFSFDLNQDHLVRTQSETEGKLALMREYPPVVLNDHHEFGYYRSFFPPNDDPVYHETPEHVVRQINDTFGPAYAREFRRNGWAFFNRGYGYDLFAPRFTDTFAVMAYGAAGMTIEVYDGGPLHKRFDRQLTVMWSMLATAAGDRRKLLRQLHDTYVSAMQEGRRGQLQPNRTYEPRSRPQRPVDPNRVRHYFVTDQPTRQRETAMLIRRLQSVDVQVYRLTEDLRVPDLRPLLEGPRGGVVGSGDYWIPMAQPQKRFIQAAMNEDPFNPTNSAYRVSSWSLPLAYNLDASMSGAKLDPVADLVAPVAEPPGPVLPDPMPSIAIMHLSRDFTAYEAVGHTRWLFRRHWGVPYSEVDAHEVADGALDGIDVIVVPAGGINEGLRDLGTRGQRALIRWVNRGGRMIAWRYGAARLAYALGISRAVYDQVPGSIDGPMVKAMIDPDSPLRDGVGRHAWAVVDTAAMRAPKHRSPLWFPTRESGKFRVSGLKRSTHRLQGTTAVADEPVGRGRSIVFSFDPIADGGAEGTQKVLFNAIFGPEPAGFGRAAPAVYDADRVARRWAATVDWVDSDFPVH